MDWRLNKRLILTARAVPRRRFNSCRCQAHDRESPVEVSLPIFDRQRIDGLSEGLGAALMSNLLTRCLASMEQYLSDIGRGADEGDFMKVRRAAHDLKSVCAQFGAIRASEIARAIEEELPDLEAVKNILPELKDCVGQAAARIQDIQSQMSASGTRPGQTAA